MKVLFTNSPLHFTHGHTFTQPDWQTLILPLLAAIVGDKHEVKLIDNMRYSFFKSNNIMDEIEAFRPEVVGFSIIASRDIFNTISIIRSVREKYPGLVIIAGGQAGTYYYKWLHEEGVNFVVHGEGEITLKELIEAIASGTRDYSGILGISYLSGNLICKNGHRPMIKTLDESPIPAFHLMPEVKSKWFPGKYTGSVEMSRGCPFNCNFCAITAFWKRTFRQKSNERIIEELEILKKQNRTHVYLADDNFGMNATKQIGLFKMMIERDMGIKFFAQIRTDTIANNPEMIEWAAKAGLYGVLVGFDTYDPEMFNDITKTTSIDLNIKAAEILRKNKIAIFGCHIYDLPAQKGPLDFFKTFWLGRKYSDLFRMPRFSPLPFTKNYEQTVKVNPDSTSMGAIKGGFEKEFRPRFGDEKRKRRMAFGYNVYTWVHNLSPSELFLTLFHPNPVVRNFKRYGYISFLRHYFYKIIRRFKLTDI